ncbi:tRNA (guanosine(37)-N1)-methyltransferase TrmD [Exiguobacterium sp. s193]|uniref:tRNA (guanosine(37)-N1)-methyltransferase TrmD n=1 Tax=Exiguobacterium sp. s193 TaxID=2751207 RepID=UPI001BECE48C|nr:tRNA (guanosine(37)-N1)-methyltransferase TrmD [Exiguobacterium sp. s193]
MNIKVLTLFPDMFTALNHSIVGRAQEEARIHLEYINFRDYSTNRHGRVDDSPYGGGAGMLLTPQPVFDAVAALPKANRRIIAMTPTGQRFDQKIAEKWARESELVFLCGHYEGFDQRIHDELVTDEVSLGDFVLTGGELAAMTMIDAVVRLLPDVLGKSASHEDDSFSTGLLEYPHYTRPADYNGLVVPDVLLSGNHAKIEQWRRQQALKRTQERRPDLLESADLSASDLKYLRSISGLSKE